MTALEIVITIFTAFIASSGFWAYLMKHKDRKSISNQMLLGLGHDRIIYLGLKYIERGYITKDEYENLNDYLFVPYQKMGGNGSAARIMAEVNKLEIRGREGTLS